MPTLAVLGLLAAPLAGIESGNPDDRVLPSSCSPAASCTLGATFGVMVWMFQDGNLASVFGFTPTPVNLSMLVLSACVAFGLSMDYEVFLLGRIKEARDRGESSDEAVVAGVSKTGRIITSCAALLAVSFFAFVTGNVSIIQLFGLATGLAILIDATIVRIVLVPAVMKLLGESS